MTNVPKPKLLDTPIGELIDCEHVEPRLNAPSFYCPECGTVQALGTGHITCRRCGRTGLRGFNKRPKRVTCPDHPDWRGWDDGGVNDDIGRHMRAEHPSKVVGWAWPAGSRKEHAFVEGRALCGKYAMFLKSEHMDRQPGGDPCAMCAREVEKRRARA